MRHVARGRQEEPVLDLREELLSARIGEREVGLDRTEIVHALFRFQHPPGVDHLRAFDVAPVEQVDILRKIAGIDEIAWLLAGGSRHGGQQSEPAEQDRREFRHYATFCATRRSALT